MNRRLPLVTLALLVANVAVYLLGPRAAGSCAQTVFAQRWGAVPWELTHNRQLPLEQIARCSVPEFDKSPALSALTSLFVHASAAHLIGNLLLLAIVGASVERRIGAARFAVLYLVCGYTAAYGFAFAAASDTRPLIGASGAVAGALAAHLWLRPRDLILPLLALPLLLPVPGPSWLVGQPGGNVAYTAHAVGLAVGLVLAALYYPDRGRSAESPHPTRAGQTALRT
ncbi:MAG: rhomboid family intramembrane serine protease [Sporichthyaceae bacterium]